MSKTSFLVAVALVAMSAPAFAVDNVTWEQFVAQCANPKGGKDQQKQFQPEDIQIQCEIRNKEYVEETPGVYDLPASAQITASVVSNKMAVAASTVQAAAAGRSGECVRYKERERVIRFTQLLTCDDVQRIAQKGQQKGGDKDGQGKGGKDGQGKGQAGTAVGSPTDFCQDQGKGKHEGKDSFVEEHDTGVVRNSCPADARFDHGDQGKGDKGQKTI